MYVYKRFDVRMLRMIVIEMTSQMPTSISRSSAQSLSSGTLIFCFRAFVTSHLNCASFGADVERGGEEDIFTAHDTL